MSTTAWVLLYLMFALLQAILVVRLLNKKDKLDLGTTWVLVYALIAPLVSVGVLVCGINCVIQGLLSLGVGNEE